jgi:hypothetical protein
MRAWTTKEDIDSLFRRVCDDPDFDEDDLQNSLLGLMYVHDNRMNELWNTFTLFLREHYKND